MFSVNDPLAWLFGLRWSHADIQEAAIPGAATPYLGEEENRHPSRVVAHFPLKANGTSAERYARSWDIRCRQRRKLADPRRPAH